MSIACRFSLLILATVISFTGSFAQKKKITLEDVFLKNTFGAKNVPGFNLMHNEQFYSAVETEMVKEGEPDYSIHIYRLSDKKDVDKVFSTAEALKEYPGEHHLFEYAFSDDEDWLLLKFNGEHIYRRSARYNTYLYHIPGRKIVPIDTGKVLHAQFNAKGTHIAYVKENNLFVYDIRKERSYAVTTDGKWNHIINGNCDWVYEEEFGFTQAYQWSPDGRYLAFYRFDESRVKEYSMTMYQDGLYPEQYVYKYPKAGESNSIVEIRVFDLESGSTAHVDIGKETDQYIPRIKWANAAELCVLRMNRLQNHLEYLFYDVRTKTTEKELDDVNPYYVDVLDPLIFYNKGNNFLVQSERDGYMHIYSFDRKSSKLTRVTKGSFDVAEVIGYNEQSGLIYFTAGMESPMDRKLYSVNQAGNKLQTITKQEGWNTVSAFPSMKHFLIRSSSFSKVPQTTLIDNKGKVISILEDNRAFEKKLAEYDWGNRTFIRLKAADSTTDLNAWMIRPPDFSPGKKYPVLMYQYSGPGSQEVENSFLLGNYFWHQYMAQEGYIVICVDGRGTGARGQEFKKCTYLRLGKIESEDQIAAARQIAAWDFVDKDRMGIWGWSYGGFMSATCILKGNDVFKTAVSVAPVTNWRYYDNIYTERFMRTPQENPAGYDDNSPVNMVKKLSGNLLIIHGTADDNVHFQNAVMLTNALIKNNKQFESIYYPDKDHGIYGGNTRYQLFTKITRYLKENL